MDKKRPLESDTIWVKKLCYSVPFAWIVNPASHITLLVYTNTITAIGILNILKVTQKRLIFYTLIWVKLY